MPEIGTWDNILYKMLGRDNYDNYENPWNVGDPDKTKHDIEIDYLLKTTKEIEYKY